MASKNHKTQSKQRPWSGSKWIQMWLRLAIYLRDGLACAYCGKGVEDGTLLSLDHILCFSSIRPTKEEARNPQNLITACKACNSRRQAMTLEDWCNSIGKPEAIAYVKSQALLPPDVVTAKALIKKYGTSRRATDSMMVTA